MTYAKRTLSDLAGLANKLLDPKSAFKMCSISVKPATGITELVKTAACGWIRLPSTVVSLPASVSAKEAPRILSGEGVIDAHISWRVTTPGAGIQISEEKSDSSFEVLAQDVHLLHTEEKKALFYRVYWGNDGDQLRRLAYRLVSIGPCP